MCDPPKAEVSNILLQIVFRGQMWLRAQILMIPDISEKPAQLARRAFRVQEMVIYRNGVFTASTDQAHLPRMSEATERSSAAPC